MKKIAIHPVAVSTAAAAFLLILAGGSVTSTGSSLAVPDWPLSYGQFFPAMRGGVFFEHGHRLIAGVTGLAVWALAAMVLRSESRAWVRRTAIAVAALIVVQAVLGGVTVLYGLPPRVSIVHAILGQSLFTALILLAQATSPTFASLRPATDGLWKPGAAAATCAFVQLALGAWLRHTGTGLAWHLLGALAALCAVSLTAVRGLTTGRPSLQAPSLALAALATSQLFLGLGALLARSTRAISWTAALPTLHQTTGAAILALAAVWTLRASRSEPTQDAA